MALSGLGGSGFAEVLLVMKKAVLIPVAGKRVPPRDVAELLSMEVCVGQTARVKAARFKQCLSVCPAWASGPGPPPTLKWEAWDFGNLGGLGPWSRSFLAIWFAVLE